MAIVESNIAAPPASYEAYRYSYTNLQNEKKYVGIHMGSVDDAYQHSSTNEEFQNAFSDSDSEFKFEVFMYGSYNEMRNQEHNTLSKVDARNNPQYYNKTNGFPAYPEPDLDKCKAFVEQYLEGVYNVGKEPIDLHVNMLYIQVRFENDAALQKEIKEKIDDALGNTDKCSPVLVYEGRGPNGEDLRGDATHTVFGAAQSKHATHIPVARIPYEIHKDFTDAELKAIGNLLNKRPDVIKKPIDKKTAIKHIIDNAEHGVPYNSNNNVAWLKAYGFTGSLSKGQIKTIVKDAKALIDTRELAKANQLFINYKAAPHHQTLLDTVTAFGQPNEVCSIYMSSAKFSSDRIIETLWANKALGKKIIMVVIHHPDLAQEKFWKTQDQPRWLHMFDYLLCDGFEVRFHEMPTTMSDGSK